MTSVATILSSMVDYSQGNLHDIEHFLKVWGYAKTIGELAGLDRRTQYILELAAITHDIACPLCREKYGNTNGKHQEQEGPALARALLEAQDVPEDIVERVAWLVGHHHTYTGVDGPDYQILLEADYLVNARESPFSQENIRHAHKAIFKTPAARSLLERMYLR